MELVIEHWEYFMLGFVMLEKIVKATPTEKDDIIFDMIVKPIFNAIKPKDPKRQGGKK